jgi:effector-binding domain-containing protein
MNRTIKWILIILGSLLAIFFILALVMPKDYEVKRSITIKAPATQVHDSLKSLRFFQKWAPWNELDPNMKITYKGTDGEVGSGYTWEGNKEVGKGEMELTKVTENRIDNTVHFLEPWESTSGGYYLIEPAQGETKVTWGMTGTTPFPWNAMCVFMSMDKMIGKDFEKGLNKLKSVMESSASATVSADGPYEVKEIQLDERVYIMKQATIKIDEAGKFYEQNLPMIFQAVGKQKLEMAGHPTGLFFMWDEKTQKADMAAALPVNAKKDVKVDGYATYVLEPTKALQIDYFGDYNKTAAAHMQMDAYIKAKGLEQAGPVLEEYVTDPGVEKDTTKWLTRIVYTVK